jgi:hypothetical protein
MTSKETPAASFARPAATVLDCANGYQKEKQEKLDGIEESRSWESHEDEKANAEGEDSQEVLKKDLCCEESYGQREDGESNGQQDGERGR